MSRLAYCGEKISPHLIRDNAGFLIAMAQPIARSGWQTCKRSEIDPSSSDDALVSVYRPPEEVTSAATIASAEGKPVTMRHPPNFLDKDTVGWSSRGHIQNVRVGPRDEDGNVTVVADLHIHDGTLIDAVLSKNLRDLSCGYVYDIDEGPRKGTYAQRKIRMNHVAVVESGRAGTTYICDSEDNDDMDNAKLDRLCDLLEQFLKMKGYAEDDEENGVVPVNSEGGKGNINPLVSRDSRVLRRRNAASDSHTRRQVEAETFERSAGRLHRRNYSVHSDPQEDRRRASDTEEPELSFDEAVAKARREQQARFAPKKR